MNFSIIIPAYNCEDTIIETVESIVAVQIDKMEIIIVDDGSTDSTREKCKQIIDKHPNVRYYYQMNAGVSSARNVGIELAVGQYIILWDSDDVANSDLLQTCMLKALEKDVDILIFGMEFIYTYDNKQIYIQISQCDKEEQFGRVSFAERLPYLFDINYLSSGCNKILKRSICKKVNYNTQKRVFEDLLYVLDYLSYCKSIYIMPELAYIYNIELLRKKASRVMSIDDFNDYMRDFQNSVLALENVLAKEIPELRQRIGSVYEWMFIEKLEYCTYSELKKLDPIKMRPILFDELYCAHSNTIRLYYRNHLAMIRAIGVYHRIKHDLIRRVKSLYYNLK